MKNPTDSVKQWIFSLGNVFVLRYTQSIILSLSTKVFKDNKSSGHDSTKKAATVFCATCTIAVPVLSQYNKAHWLNINTFSIIYSNGYHGFWYL